MEGEGVVFGEGSGGWGKNIDGGVRRRESDGNEGLERGLVGM